MIALFLRDFYNVLIISILQKPQKLAPFSAKKASPQPSPEGKGVRLVNLSNCKQKKRWRRDRTIARGVNPWNEAPIIFPFPSGEGSGERPLR